MRTNAIDLGLSVLWAARNVGAAEKTDKGIRMTWEEALARQGEDWRLPTEQEAQELITFCVWTQRVINARSAGYDISRNAERLYIPMDVRAVMSEEGGRRHLVVARAVAALWTSTPAGTDARTLHLQDGLVYAGSQDRDSRLYARMVRERRE